MIILQFDTGKGFDVGLFDRVLVNTLTYKGLQLLKCANWAEGPSHGGILSEYAVDVFWDYVSEYENINGVTDYRKAYIKNYGTASTGSCVIRPGFLLPNALVGRFNAHISLGTNTDNLTAVLNNSSAYAFLSGLSITIAPGQVVPIWVKRIVTAGGSPAKSYLGLQFFITISES